MAYCIMRAEKRGRGAVYGLQIEANRTGADAGQLDFADSDIRWDETDSNVRLRQADSWGREITREIKAAGVRERKDSIVMIDAVYTASPDFFEGMTRADIVRFFVDCLDYHDREYGRAFNAVIHFDEQTPHMQVASVPIIKDEKGAHLSAKLLMGNRTDYHRRQDRFYEQVGREWGLERGEARDPEAKAERKVHTAKRDWQIRQQEQTLTEQQNRLRWQERKLAEVSGQIEEQEQRVGVLDRTATTEQLAESAKPQLFDKGRVSVPVEVWERTLERGSAGEHIQQQRDEVQQERQNAAADRQAAEAAAEQERLRFEQVEAIRSDREYARAYKRYQQAKAQAEQLEARRDALSSDVSRLTRQRDQLQQEVGDMTVTRYERRFLNLHSRELERFIDRERSQEWER